MVLGDRYRLEREIGSGGAASVWRAEDFLAGREVAVKLLHATEAGPDRRERLQREARLLESLHHDHVVRVFDVGEHEGRPYIVMELLEGGTLADRVRREGPLRPADAVRALLEVLDALGRAHELGIVHRDVKPGNLLLRATGEVVLCDFGIARVAEDGDTRTGVALGSMGYMAPEQRIDARRVGPGADVYAAACTLFHLVTADTPVDLYLAPDSSPRWEAVPAPLRPVLRKATRSEPSARHEGAAELAADLEALLPALEAMPAARSRAIEPVGHVPTRAAEPEPSVTAEHRQRYVDRDEWSWSARGRPVGRSALWVGVATVLLATGLSFALGPLADRLAPEVPPAAAAEAPPPVDLDGRWQGTVGGHPAELELHAGPVVTGQGVVHLGAGAAEFVVTGALREGELVLSEASGARKGTWRARVGQTGLVLEGELTRPDEDPLPFGFVRAPSGDAP